MSLSDKFSNKEDIGFQESDSGTDRTARETPVSINESNYAKQYTDQVL